MYKGKRIIALIPARGGSKGVPRKNVRLLAGKPLITYTIEAARGTRWIDRTILSSDDENIIGVAKAAGCEVPFVRPAALATDEAGVLDVVRHALDEIGDAFDYLVLLQPTSPFRTAEDIDRAIELCVENQVDTCCSVVETEKSPFWMFTLSDQQKLVSLIDSSKKLARRQEAPPTYVLNGAVYVAKVDHLVSGGGFLDSGTLGYVMPKNRSIDIDSTEDFDFAKYLIGKMKVVE